MIALLFSSTKGTAWVRVSRTWKDNTTRSPIKSGLGELVFPAVTVTHGPATSHRTVDQKNKDTDCENVLRFSSVQGTALMVLNTYIDLLNPQLIQQRTHSNYYSRLAGDNNGTQSSSVLLKVTQVVSGTCGSWPHTLHSRDPVSSTWFCYRVKFSAIEPIMSAGFAFSPGTWCFMGFSLWK